jgi:hypothetical protein
MAPSTAVCACTDMQERPRANPSERVDLENGLHFMNLEASFKVSIIDLSICCAVGVL